MDQMTQITEDLAKLEVKLRDDRDDFVCQSFTSTYPACIVEKAAVGVFYMMQAEKVESEKAVEFLRGSTDKYSFELENDRDVIMVYLKD